MIQLNLRQRLLLLSLLPSALLAVVLVVYFVISGMRSLEGELRERGGAIVRYLAPVSEYGVISGNLESLQSLVQTTIQQPGVKAAVVVNRSGQILAVSGRVSLSSGQLRRSPAVPGVVSETDDWIAFGAPVLRSLAETDSLFDPAGAKAAPEILGQTFVELDKTELVERQQDLIQRGVLIIIVGLLLMALVALGIADSVTRPVNRLLRAVRAIGQGQFDTRVEDKSFGEFQELEKGFNHMASRIAEVHQTMQERIESATAQLAFQARHDALTGLVNRREFEARVEMVISSIQAGGDECSLLFIDLDRFKTINDTCGHVAGDELLQQVARLFQGRLREEDTVARIGGDEFGVLLVNCVGQRAMQVAEDLCSLIADYRFIWQDKVFSIGASIGIAPINAQVRTITEVLAAGDAACYMAKEQGRNRIHAQTAVLPQQNRRRSDLAWQDRITGALSENRLTCEALPLLRFSPKADADNFVEISVRLEEHNTPAIPPSMLLDAAERLDLAPAIDRHLLQSAASTLARVARHKRQMRCLIPMSAASVRQGKIIELLAQTLEDIAIPRDSLFLLLSEECAVQHAGHAMELSKLARSLGCGIVLGEFGGGFSSFNHLHTLKPDCVKISRSLTRSLDSNRSALVLIRAIQEITAGLGIESIAEGVDDLTAFNMLQDLGITYAQGKAVAPSEPFEDWIEGAVIRGG